MPKEYAKHMIWAAAVMVLGVLTAVSLRPSAALVLVGAVTGIVLPVVGALLVGKVEGLRQQMNGNLTRMMDIIENQGKQLATMAPAPPVDPKDEFRPVIGRARVPEPSYV